MLSWLFIAFILGDTQYIVWSTSSDKGLFALVGGKQIKNKTSYLARIGGKNKKDGLKLVFYHENRQIPYDLSAFLIKISLFFLHVGGKNKKKLNCQFFFLVGHDFFTSEDLVDQTIY